VNLDLIVVISGVHTIVASIYRYVVIARKGADDIVTRCVREGIVARRPVDDRREDHKADDRSDRANQHQPHDRKILELHRILLFLKLKVGLPTFCLPTECDSHRFARVLTPPLRRGYFQRLLSYHQTVS
jgi:hypothetical protein